MSKMSIKIEPIEPGIPIPKRGARAGGELSATFRKMKVGDSFLYPASNRNTLGSAARYVGIKIVTRKEGTDKVRCWKIGEKSAKA